MRLGGDTVGRWGLGLMALTGVAGAVLAWHGWTSGASVVPSLAAGSAPAGGSTAASSPGQPRGTGSPAGAATSSGTASPPPSASPTNRAAPSASATGGGKAGKAGPLLSSEPFANVAYQVWPGPISSAAKLALTGLHVSVRQQGTGLSVTAGVNGQPASAPHLYLGGTRVYVVEAALGDDSGGGDYNLGDDGLVVTNAQGRIIQ